MIGNAAKSFRGNCLSAGGALPSTWGSLPLPSSDGWPLFHQLMQASNLQLGSAIDTSMLALAMAMKGLGWVRFKRDFE